MRLIFGRFCQMHGDTAIEHRGFRGCGGFWQTNGEREEVEASHIEREMQTLGQGFGVRGSWLSLVHRVGFGCQITKKMCLSQHAPNTMNFDGRDLEWEFKDLLKCITSTVQCCVDLDLVFHWVHYLPKIRLLLNEQYFLDSCGIQFWKTK